MQCYTISESLEKHSVLVDLARWIAESAFPLKSSEDLEADFQAAADADGCVDAKLLAQHWYLFDLIWDQ